MENFLSRYRNVSILVAVLFAQVLGLAVQVKRSTENESTRLIRVWTVSAVSPLEKAIVWFQSGTSNLWHGYVYLRGVRQENRELKDEIEKLRLERVRLVDDAEQARRLQALLGFKEQYISKTTAAQVIGSSGSEQSAGPEVFLNILVRPATNLSKLEEVLVITRKEERPAAVAETAPARAVDILSQRLPSVPDKPRENAVTAAGKTTGTPNPAAATSGATQGPAASVPAPKTPPAAKNATTSKPSRAQVATDAVPAPNVQPLAKGAKKPGVDASSTSTSTTVKPAIAQKPTPPAVKVSQQTTKPIDAPPKPEQQPAVTPAPPEDKPQ